MSSANREKRQRNREARLAAEEYAQQHAVRRRITIGVVGLVIAAVVGIALVARATNDNGSAASSTTTTTIASATGKPCVAVKTPLPKKTPAIPVDVGAPPKSLLIRDIKKGTGAVVNPGANVKINYVLVACSTGKVIESSFTKGQPIDASLGGNIIPGWSEGIPGMRVGGLRLLGIPPELAYGATGQPPDIAPDETLWFVVKAVKLGTTASSTTVPAPTATAAPTTATTTAPTTATTTAP